MFYFRDRRAQAFLRQKPNPDLKRLGQACNQAKEQVEKLAEKLFPSLTPNAAVEETLAPAEGQPAATPQEPAAAKDAAQSK